MEDLLWGGHMQMDGYSRVLATWPWLYMASISTESLRFPVFWAESYCKVDISCVASHCKHSIVPYHQILRLLHLICSQYRKFAVWQMSHRPNSTLLELGGYFVLLPVVAKKKKIVADNSVKYTGFLQSFGLLVRWKICEISDDCLFTCSTSGSCWASRRHI